jgi:hypothetical protein
VDRVEWASIIKEARALRRTKSQEVSKQVGKQVLVLCD